MSLGKENGSTGKALSGEDFKHYLEAIADRTSQEISDFCDLADGSYWGEAGRRTETAALIHEDLRLAGSLSEGSKRRKDGNGLCDSDYHGRVNPLFTTIFEASQKDA